MTDIYPEPTRPTTEDAANTVAAQTTQVIAAVSLQAIVEEERRKRIDAENMAKALVEEFASCNDFDDVRAKFRDKVREVAPMALVNIVNLMNNSESDSVRANLNKWILEWAMSDKIDGSASELNQLIRKLQNQPVGPTPTS